MWKFPLMEIQFSLIKVQFLITFEKNENGTFGISLEPKQDIINMRKNQLLVNFNKNVYLRGS